MTAKELLKKLNENNVLSVDFYNDNNTAYVEDSESYAGYAYIKFDKNGNAIEVTK